MKPRRFFYHYYRQYNCMSVHFHKQCIKVDDVVCSVPTETKWNPTQPRLVIRGYATQVDIQEKDGKKTAYIL